MIFNGADKSRVFVVNGHICHGHFLTTSQAWSYLIGWMMSRTVLQDFWAFLDSKYDHSMTKTRAVLEIGEGDVWRWMILQAWGYRRYSWCTSEWCSAFVFDLQDDGLHLDWRLFFPCSQTEVSKKGAPCTFSRAAMWHFIGKAVQIMISEDWMQSQGTHN